MATAADCVDSLRLNARPQRRATARRKRTQALNSADVRTSLRRLDGRERSYRLATLLAVSDLAYLGSLKHYRARFIAPDIDKSSLVIAKAF